MYWRTANRKFCRVCCVCRVFYFGLTAKCLFAVCPYFSTRQTIWHTAYYPFPVVYIKRRSTQALHPCWSNGYTLHSSRCFHPALVACAQVILLPSCKSSEPFCEIARVWISSWSWVPTAVSALLPRNHARGANTLPCFSFASPDEPEKQRTPPAPRVNKALA